jgi:hypothetical protein
MSLEGNSITTWDQMKNNFSERYRYYCRARDIRNEIFIMTQGPNESLEDFEEIFQLSYKRAQNCTLDEDSIKLVLLVGVREDLMETLNLLSNGDIYQLIYDDIKRIFKNHSRKKGRSSRELVPQSSNPTTHIKNELRGLIEDMKTDILHSLSMQMDTLQIKKKHEETEKALVVYYPKCTKKHPRNECPLDLIDVCGICKENHPTNKCPSLPGLKATFRRGEENVESLYFINQRRPEALRPFQTGLNFNPTQNFGAYNVDIMVVARGIDLCL